MIEITTPGKGRIEVGKDCFPDGTTMLLSLDEKEELSLAYVIMIRWAYENENELIRLMYVSKHFHDLYPDKSQILYMPYVPNARMDRVKRNCEVFTLKWFAEIINSLDFKAVYILDPHSNVTPALIDRVNVAPMDEVFAEIGRTNEFDTVYFPDESAMKRYRENFSGKNIIYGKKTRDWETGKILGVQVCGEADKAENVLVVDDIISKGGSVYYGLEALTKAHEPKNIMVYATHVEDSIYMGDLFRKYIGTGKAKLITTDSVVRQDKMFTEQYKFNLQVIGTKIYC